MNSLKELQQAFQRYILGEVSDIEATLQLPSIGEIGERLDIYKRGYFYRFLDILGNDFRAFKAWVGAENFSKIVTAYLRSQRSTYYSIRELGKHFPSFIHQHNEAYLGELADFEWILNQVLVDRREITLTLEDLARMDPSAWETLVFRFQPYVRLIKCEYNTLDLWVSLIHHQQKIGTQSITSPVGIQIWAYGVENFYRALSPLELVLHELIEAKKPFQAVCESFLEYMPEEEVIGWVGAHIRQWVCEGLFCVFE